MNYDILNKGGKFFLGCNYWASHAGTAMWSDWQPHIVDRDLKVLSASGVQVLRVFPIWSDFQPINQMYMVLNKPAECRHGEELLSDSEAGMAGISEEAFARFEEFLHIAEKYDIKLIVGLITGWMSGRMFAPPALQGKNPLTDPKVIKWEVRFVKYFVKRFADKHSIIAWDLGNECNCMGTVPDRDAAWLWTSVISNAIKSSDQDRPVVSGMHGLTVDEKWNWTIEDQAELTDVLTTHPYPVFTPHCRLDPINTIRTVLQASSQTCYYRDLGGRTCFVEEMGSLGPMYAGENAVADFVRANLFSLYAHDCKGMLWWCNHDQNNLEQAPYNWIAMERELGLFRQDNSPKAAAEEISAFKKLLDKLPFERLPGRIIDGICILSQDQDHWGVAYSSFILAKQAGIDIEYQTSEQPIKRADVYLLPCISGTRVISKHRWNELLEQVLRGAVLYISYNDGYLTEFEKCTGLRVHTRQVRKGSTMIDFAFTKEIESLQLESAVRIKLESAGATIHAREADGNIAFSCMEYGKGKVYFLALPLETYMTKYPGLFHEDGAAPYWKIYREVFSNSVNERIITKENPLLGITEHPFDECTRIAILINYSTAAMEEYINLSSGWEISDTLYGIQPKAENGLYNVSIKENNAVILFLKDRSKARQQL